MCCCRHCSGGHTRKHGAAGDYDVQIQNVQRAQSLQHVSICLHCSCACVFILFHSVESFLPSKLTVRRLKLKREFSCENA